jgi:branched-chain amino acid transport system substrate-binding protein
MKKYPKIISHVRIKNDQVRLTYFNDFFSSSYNHNFVQVILTKSHMKPKKLTFFLASFLLIFTSCEKPRNWQDEYEPQPVFRIGVLLSLSGSGASTGQSTKVSIDLARQDITAWLGTIGSSDRFQISIADTKTDTAEALKQTRNFYNQGIRLVIGPYSSAEVAAIKSFADSHGILVVSPSSVAVSLAIPGDNIFRFVTSDLIEGKAMAEMLLADSIRAIVPMIRNDVWGNDLLKATADNFTGQGGMFNPAVKYDPKAVSFTSELALLDSTVSRLLASYNIHELAVYLCSFGEGTAILAAAGNYPHLKMIRWYGGSAFAQNASLLADTVASGFALSHDLPCPIFGLDETAKYKWQPLIERIQSVLGRAPEVYALTAYDAVWVGVKTYIYTGFRRDIAMFKSAFTTEASNYFGVTGNTTLDANGDRAYGNYDFWAVKQIQSSRQWQVIARYNSATGILTRLVK